MGAQDLATRSAGIFAAGDCATGGTTVIEAIAGGQRAAVNIDKFLGGSGRLPPDVGFTLTKPDEEDAARAPGRVVQKSIDLHKRRLNFHEVALGLDMDEAVREANRCLRCDLER
jgi:NADPH-dependent glutamate synthase beta subunit-like oxidoreductase